MVVCVYDEIYDSAWAYLEVLTYPVFNVKFLHWFLCLRRPYTITHVHSHITTLMAAVSSSPLAEILLICAFCCSVSTTTFWALSSALAYTPPHHHSMHQLVGVVTYLVSYLHNVGSPSDRPHLLRELHLTCSTIHSQYVGCVNQCV